MQRIWAASLLLAVSAPAVADDSNCREMLEFTGAPVVGDEQPVTRLCRLGYVLEFDLDRRTPDWVLEVLTPDRLTGEAERDDIFKQDPDFPAAQNSSPKDYRGSGYDRGHQAPAADMAWSEEAMRQSFYFTNMAPQVGVGFNRGIWKDLESYVRDLVAGRSAIVVITGPIYENQDEKIGKVTVPTHFYKILYDPEEEQAIAFLLPNENLKGHKWKDYVVTIDEIEEATDIDFLELLPDRKEKGLERRQGEIWRVFEGS